MSAQGSTRERFRFGWFRPAHLCDQWERALREKFAIETVLVQPSQIRRLERNLPPGDVSIYEYYSNFVASIDFVKSKSQRDQFLAHPIERAIRQRRSLLVLRDLPGEYRSCD